MTYISGSTAVESLTETSASSDGPFSLSSQMCIRDRRYTTHDFAGFHQRYDLIGLLLQEPDLRVGRVLGATVHLLDAAAMWQAALSALQRDPLAFVEPAASEAA